MATLPLLTAMLVAVAFGCSPAKMASAEKPAGILPGLELAFKQKNPLVREPRVLEIRPNPGPSEDTRGEYLALATMRTQKSQPQALPNDELFGVFAIDSTLTRVERVIDIFPTRRWADYSIRFEWSSQGTLEVVGSGEMYGDQVVRRQYDWSPKAGAHALVREYTLPSDSSAAADE